MSNNFDPRTNPNWFIDQLTFYQAANSSPEAIKRNFLIRIAEFETITEQLRNKKYADPVQHELILGRRGSGKSTLLRRIQIEIDEDADLSAKYIAINLAEEQAAIYRLSDLWFEVLEELMIRFDQRRKLREFNSFDDNQAYTRYLYSEINQLLNTAKKKAVLLLDNLDRILENFSDDANLLRETLLNHNDLAIIGGSTRMDEHFWDYRKPFYEFFRRHRLEGLTFGEIHELLNHWAAEMQLPVLHDYALRNRGKVEAIRILTDGLPRALQFFIQILLHDSALYGFDYLRKVMDRATPLYQERLNNLTAPQRKIVQEMAFHWQAIPTKLLAERCRMESKLISSYLKQLDGFGVIETIPTGNKNHLYRIAERFFNMWLIVTQGNPDQKRRAKYLTLFLESFYDKHELVELAKGHIEKLKAGEIGFDKAMVMSKGLVHSRYIGIMERDSIIDLTLMLHTRNGQVSELPVTSSELLLRLDKLFEEEQYDNVIKKMEEIENEADGFKFYIQGFCFEKMGKLKMSKKFYEKALKSGNYSMSENIESHDNTLENKNLVETDNIKLLKEIKANSLYGIANVSFAMGREQDAEKYYSLASYNGHLNAKLNLALLYYFNNKNTAIALSLVKEYFEKSDDKSSQLIVLLLEVWNGKFDGGINKIKENIKSYSNEDLSTMINLLLSHSQTHLVLSLFHDPELGKDLIAKYELLYYATLILANETGDNLLLRIPPEVMPTVEQIVAEVREKQAFYAQPPKE